MLELRNLSKVYRSKTGEEVRALDNVSISFPESGMVFILGKSGSGKSTLLNIMGGLDSYDSGEFIIKGKSSKDFAGSDFDAYRNTFIGFIFQEYNVLDDFTVGANIGLALELQGKKATDEKINEILSQVDLLSYAKRKPNELSGGQKQRVAIARALVKEPQIIMADEPTGALDSNTGKQIFDALKALSREKLVLIVSHDRDFAERYADRIIELSDGKILSDVTKHERHSIQLSEGIQQINSQILRIKGGYRLTENDLRMINDYLSRNENDIILSGDGRINDELRSAAGISAEGNTSVFEGTNTEKDYTLKKYQKEDSKFIHSKLPLKNAMKMGSSSLKHKKFRLVMTILLSLLAFALFGFADTMAGYEKISATVDSIMDSNVKNASVSVSVRHTITYDEGDSFTNYQRATMNDEDIAYLSQQTGLQFVPVFTGGNQYGNNGGFSVTNLMQSYNDDSIIYTGKLHGLVCLDQEDLATTGFSVSGRLPEKEGEIAITELMYRQLNEYGFSNSEFKETVAAGSLVKEKGSDNSIIGKHLTLSNGLNSKDGKGYSFVIVGVIDTQFDYERYADYLPKKDNDIPVEEDGNALSEMVLTMEIDSELNYGFHGLGFTTNKDIESLSSLSSNMNQNIGTYMSGWDTELYISLNASEQDLEKSEIQLNQVAGSSALSKLSITWLDGKSRTKLAADEVVLPSRLIENFTKQEATIRIDAETVKDEAVRLYGEENWDATNVEDNYWNRLTVAANLRYTDSRDQSQIEKDLLPLVENIFGIDVPDGVPTDQLSYMYDVLRSTSEVNPEYNFTKYNIEEILRNIYGYQDVQSNRLWENQAFINLMLESNYSDITQQNWAEFDENSKQQFTTSFYSWYLSNSDYGYEENSYGSHTGKELSDEAQDIFSEMSGFSIEDLLSNLKFERFERNYELDHSTSLGEYKFKVVGVYDSDITYFGDILISDTALADYQTWVSAQESNMSYKEDIAEHDDGIWAFALAPLGTDRSVVEKLVTMSYDETSDLRFEMHNPVINTLDTFNEFIEIGSLIFLYVGIGFAVFSALLLMNFISTSISYKKREIGVLRAVGARSSDVFKIFFSEALIIAVINFILSTALVIAAIIVTNTWMHNSGINVTLLSYGPRQFILMLAISILVALLASFLPVYNIAKRKPIDAIRDR